MENKEKFKQKLEFSKGRSYYKRCLLFADSNSKPNIFKR